MFYHCGIFDIIHLLFLINFTQYLFCRLKISILCRGGIVLKTQKSGGGGGGKEMGVVYI